MRCYECAACQARARACVRGVLGAQTEKVVTRRAACARIMRPEERAPCACACACACHERTPHPLQESLGRLVEAEQRVSLHAVQLAAVWVRQLGWRLGQVRGGVQAQQVVQPRLDGVAAGIPVWARAGGWLRRGGGGWWVAPRWWWSRRLAGECAAAVASWAAACGHSRGDAARLTLTPHASRSPDGLLERDLPEGAPHSRPRAAHTARRCSCTACAATSARCLLPQLLDELQGQAAPRALIAIHCVARARVCVCVSTSTAVKALQLQDAYVQVPLVATCARIHACDTHTHSARTHTHNTHTARTCGAEEHQVRPKHGLNEGQRDSCCLVNHQQLRLAQPASSVVRLDVLHRLRCTRGRALRVRCACVHWVWAVCAVCEPASSVWCRRGARHAMQTLAGCHAHTRTHTHTQHTCLCERNTLTRTTARPQSGLVDSTRS
jgi:hypothetical protein